MMTPERWEKIGQIYHSALELSPSQRGAFINRACEGDEDLRQEVESLIAAEGRLGDFITKPALKYAAQMLDDYQTQQLIGGKLGSYQILACLGAGGMGEVYLARDSKLGREVAIKTLPRVFSNDEEGLRRLRTEARAAAALNHPNIATLYSVEESDGVNFITMEYVAGQSLREHISTKGLLLETFFRWFIPLADALAHAHEKGVVHRDIKPNNVVVTTEGVPKILDFGLARVNRSEMEAANSVSTLGLTADGVILGTPSYMSPEQAEGKQVDHRSDIFSFGVVMYEALTGQRPFKGESYAAIVSSMLKDEPQSIAELRPEIPDVLTRLIWRCLSKDRQNRHQTMREVRAILEEANAGASNSQPEKMPGRREKKKSTVASHRLVSVLAILTALLTGITAWSLWRLTRPIPKPITRFTINSPPGQEASLPEAQLSPDGRYMAFATRRGDLTQLFLRRLDQIESTPLPGTEKAQHPFFSPDSKWIGFYVEQEGIKKVPLAGGPVLTICGACNSAYEAPSWGEDNTIIAADVSGLYRISADGGRPEVMTTLDTEKGEITHRAPQFLPDGKNVLFTIVTKKGSHFAVLSLATRERRDLQDIGEAYNAQYIPTGHLIFSRSNQLLAAPFDLTRLEITGTITPVIDSVFPRINFKVAGNGTLAYPPDTDMKNNSLVWVDRDGQSTPILDKRANYRSPRLSSDGARVAVQVDKDIWVYEVKSGRGIRLSFEGENQVPTWMPDSKHVVFSSKRGGSWYIFRKAADNSTEAERLLISENRLVPYSMHPGGRFLAFTTLFSANNTDIGLLSLPDNKVTQILNSKFIEDTPRFSPDGRLLAYFSIETGQAEVYVQPYPSSGGRSPVSRDGGMFPVWSSDGRELFYRRGNKIYVVPVESKPKLVVGTPRVLFEALYLTSYDIAPDGKRFVMVKSEQRGRPNELNIVLNWTEELKRLVPAKN